MDIHYANCVMVNMVAAWQHHSLQEFCIVVKDAILSNFGNEDVKQLEDSRADSLDVILHSIDNCIPAYVRPCRGVQLRTPSLMS